MKNRNRLIMGTAIGVAAVAIAIDHTRHRLPEPVKSEEVLESSDYIVIEDGENAASADAAPCSLDISPCSL